MEYILSKYNKKSIYIINNKEDLFVNQLIKNENFDMIKLNEFNGNMFNDIVDHIIERREKGIIILYNDIKYYNEKKIILAKEFNEKLKSGVIKKKRKNLREKKGKISLKQIKDEFNIYFEKELKNLDNQRETIKGYSIQLNEIIINSQYTNEKTGKGQLYIGYPFVEGKLKDDTFIRSPLALFPVSLRKDEEGWKLENTLECNILLNKKLLVAMGIENINNFNTDFDEVASDFIGELSNDFHIKAEGELQDLKEFNEYSHKDMDAYKTNELILVNNMVIGQFNASSSIFNDYEELVKNQVTSPLLEKLFSSKDESKDININEVVNEKIFLISNLDYSQEKAIKMVNENDAIIINSPEDTGKYDVIANIIGDALAKDKKVLVVEKSKKSIEKIYEKLDVLNSKVMTIYDCNIDRKDFYEKLSKNLEVIEFLINENYEEIIENLDNKIIDNKNKLKFLGEVYTKKREYGLSLQEMYEICVHINKKDKKYLEDFKNFSLNEEVSSYNYCEIRKTVNKIDENIIKAYKEHKRLYKENPLIDELNLDNKVEDIDDFIENINEAMSLWNIIIEESESNKERFDRFVELYKEYSFDLSGEKIVEFSAKYNEEKNGDLLNPINEGKWWNIKYWLNYFDNKKKEEKNRVEYDKRREHILSELITLKNNLDEEIMNLKIISKVFNDKICFEFLEALFKGQEVKKYFNNAIDTLNIMRFYKDELKIFKDLSNLERKVLQYALNDDINITKEKLEEYVTFTTLYNLIKIEKKEEVKEALRNLEDFDNIIESINKDYEDKQNNLKRHILNKLSRKISTISKEEEFKEFKRQANKKRTLLSIRRYMKEYGELVLETIPCFLTYEETASEVLPLKEGLFDLVIIDEVENISMESTLPLIYRGKKVVFIGDNKKATYTKDFKNNFSTYEEVQNKVVTSESGSLLEKINTRCKNVNLECYYGSQKPVFIDFINYAFYEGKLKISPYIEYLNKEVSMERIMINGRYVEGVNEEEGNKVLDLLSYILKRKKHEESIGIVTFTSSQRQYIEKVLERKLNENDEFKSLYQREKYRIDNGEDKSILISDLESIKNFKRDIVIFSTCYGKNENGDMSLDCKILNNLSEENYLNIALRGVKNKVYIVTSMEPESLFHQNFNNKGVNIFIKYLQYVREVCKNTNKNSKEILNSLWNKSGESSLSYIENEVFNKLKSLGYNVHLNIGLSPYKVNLGVYDQNKRKYILAIECDGEEHYTLDSIIEREYYKQIYLKERGWNIIRVWAKKWWDNPIRELNKIEEKIENLNKN